MAKFFVGQPVRYVRCTKLGHFIEGAPSPEEYNRLMKRLPIGSEGTVVQLIHRPTGYVGMFGSYKVMSDNDTHCEVMFPGRTKPTICRFDELEPLTDANQKISWAECICTPEGEYNVQVAEEVAPTERTDACG